MGTPYLFFETFFLGIGQVIKAACLIHGLWANRPMTYSFESSFWLVFDALLCVTQQHFFAREADTDP